jgi:hypothetical protein
MFPPAPARALRVASRWRRTFVLVLAGWLAPTLAPAAPPGPTAPRAELARWLDELRASGAADVGAPQPWRYSFSAAASAGLEALSLELVPAGYSIETLTAGAAGVARLLVTRRELHSPATLEQRNRELVLLAGRHGVRYDGVDAPRLGR